MCFHVSNPVYKGSTTFHVCFILHCQVVIVGKLSVGKTSLLLRACKNTFSPDVQSTIGTTPLFPDICPLPTTFSVVKGVISVPGCVPPNKYR